MRCSPWTLVSLALALASSLTAQQTWVVDPGGTGNFTTLAAAIYGSTNGDTLILRGGDYPATYTLDKALNLIGDTPRPRVGGLTWVALPPGSPPIRVTGFDLGSASLRVFATSQSSAFDSMTISRITLRDNVTATFTNCTLGGEHDVYGNRNTGYPGLWVQGARVAMSGCTVMGGSGFSLRSGRGNCVVFPAAPPIECWSGELTITSSTLTGAGYQSLIPCGSNPPGPALRIFGGTIQPTRCALASGTSQLAPSPPPIERTAGTVEYDLTTSFAPTNSIGTVEFLPGTTGTSGSAGSTFTCRVESSPGVPAALIASLGTRTPAPTPIGTAWVDPANYTVLVIGATSSSGDLDASIATPAWLPRGLAITVQSVAAPATNGPLTAGAPVVLHVL
ncbi:MAG: hypothetical protein NXI31_12305 [bacterium]|nr:hypothetical protein [bacterium]